ncbi:MAG: ATP-binding protein [Saprospiraceae bacterium]|nr:ATP-binding protein [Saprospiraceae bacterium]
MDFVGRKEELNQIDRLINSSKSELCAVLGRRRIGKTFFIEYAIKSHLFFKFTGKYEAPVSIQLERFSAEIKTQLNLGYLPILESWFDAFNLLKNELNSSRKRKKKVIFLDEFPWMSTKNSYFIAAFADFWAWAVMQKDILVIICGSAGSWMIKNIFKNRGSLYNRVTSRMELSPFTLEEVAQFLKAKQINYNTDAIIKLYMIMGGIPFYLDQLDVSESLDQAIDRLFFRKKAILNLEFDELFVSLFGSSHTYEHIVKILSEHTYGLDRNTISKLSKISSGGTLSNNIDELEAAGFITHYVPYGKSKRDIIYKLTDPYVLFYLKYVQKTEVRTKNVWHYLTNTPSWYAWSGLAFENLCMLHIPEIKQQLGITGVFSTESVWRHKGDDTMSGAQIDLLIDRSDKIINICEIKYAPENYVLDKDYYTKLQNKITSFKHFTKTRKGIFVTFITPSGLFENKYSIEHMRNQVVMGKIL